MGGRAAADALCANPGRQKTLWQHNMRSPGGEKVGFIVRGRRSGRSPHAGPSGAARGSGGCMQQNPWTPGRPRRWRARFHPVRQGSTSAGACAGPSHGQTAMGRQEGVWRVRAIALWCLQGHRSGILHKRGMQKAPLGAGLGKGGACTEVGCGRGGGLHSLMNRSQACRHGAKPAGEGAAPAKKEGVEGSGHGLGRGQRARCVCAPRFEVRHTLFLRGHRAEACMRAASPAAVA